MADKEHLDILKKGADIWNKWREVNIESPERNNNLSST
jgi:hypothetical protein